MALDDIIRKIQEDAQAEADSLLSLARAEADAILAKARKQADELCEELTEKGKKRAEEHASRVEILAGLEQRKDVLKQKKRLIEEAFAGAEQRIRNLPSDEYLAFVKPL
ncbi:MAG: hypothetical protein JSV16_09900, partial [Candidatus Hydrogenedentota bacterium]